MEAATSVDKSAGGRAVDSSDAEITINLAPYKTYTELASNVSLTLTLNELQQMVLLQVAKFMDKKRDAAVRTTKGQGGGTKGSQKTHEIRVEEGT